MLTIHCLHVFTTLNVTRFDLGMATRPFTEQEAYLLNLNTKDGHIYTIPHKKSVLYEVFIKPILNKDGYPLYGNYITKLCGTKIKYLVIDDRKL
jgi:hypothetical protein